MRVPCSAFSDNSGRLSIVITLFQIGPSVLFLKLADVLDNGDRAGLDATMTTIYGSDVANISVFEICGVLLDDERIGIVAQPALIAPPGEDLVGFLSAMARLQPMAPMVTPAPSMTNRSSDSGVATTSLAFVGHFRLTKARRWRTAKAKTIRMASWATPKERCAVMQLMATTVPGPRSGPPPGLRAGAGTPALRGLQDVAEILMDRRAG
jgi:hypothetical protein